ncbi:MAG TPA: hypothetical protein DDY31_09230 [Lachnospiraceae bacterium]|nr:hypothetical protein [Lachnospiraceae bacterium]
MIQMSNVELVSYKIVKLRVNNNIPESAMLELESMVGFNVKYESNNGAAVAVLTVSVNHRNDPDLLCIELEIQGGFSMNGINDMDSKKEAHVKCYDELFPCANQIMTYLAINSGMQGFMLKKPPMEFANVNFGIRPDGMDSGKVIKLWSDI